MHLNIFIVDDEPQTRATLKALLLEFCPGTTVTGMAGDLPEALSLLPLQPVDVLFLDINLGNGNTDLTCWTSWVIITVTLFL